ncbi:MAG: T9SS type A sorting domain-containing protein [Saprospiraceae bacterium]|nr:T9SS type A sorting domain-containing protein [Candidatus Defluviibacterium haderslevense]
MKLLYFIIYLFLTPLFAASYYVSSDASIPGNGSFINPWTFQTALNHPSALHPGDTVWIKGGIYTNTYDAQTSFSCKTNGTANAPIIFRNYNNERVTIDGQLLYSLYVGLGNSTYTWFWGLEITNTGSTDRNHDIPGGITCTAENIKFINMIVHDTGTGIDCWKTAKNSETYGCLIYHIGNNLLNGTNLEGHGHGMYLQNDTFGTKIIHNNIIFNTYGYGIKVWQTTTTAALGNFDIQRNIVFNGGAASENLGGVGNNSRTHNFFVVANGENNPVRNTVIKHNYTYADQTMPRPSVNAFGLNYGVLNMTLDSNVLMCQTRLGYNNTPIFDASVKGNQIIGGIPPVYGIYLWGFTQADYPQNNFVPIVPTSGLSYFVLPNKYETGRAHIAIYNWDHSNSVSVDIANTGLQKGDKYELINSLDYFNDVITGIYDGSGTITIPMTGHTGVQAIGSKQNPIHSFPEFGAFIIRKSGPIETYTNASSPSKLISIIPNPSNGQFILNNIENINEFEFYNILGEKICTKRNDNNKITLYIDLTPFKKGIYLLRTKKENIIQANKILIQ